MIFHYVLQRFISFFSAWKVIFGICKCVVQVQEINVYRNSPHLIISLLRWAQQRMLKHLRVKSEITSMQNRTHFSLEQEHDSSRTMHCVHEDYRDSFLLCIIQIYPMFFIHLQRYLNMVNKIRKESK